MSADHHQDSSIALWLRERGLNQSSQQQVVNGRNNVFSSNNHNYHINKPSTYSKTNHYHHYNQENDDDDDDVHQDNEDNLPSSSQIMTSSTSSESIVAISSYQHHPDQFLNEALLAVASAEEYAAKILALQQACLRPLKEDLADWLNKIMSTTTITTDNFMHKLDNGVIICRLAKIISLWCLNKQQQTKSSNISDITIDHNHQHYDNTNIISHPLNYDSNNSKAKIRHHNNKGQHKDDTFVKLSMTDHSTSSHPKNQPDYYNHDPDESTHKLSSSYSTSSQNDEHNHNYYHTQSNYCQSTRSYSSMNVNNPLEDQYCNNELTHEPCINNHHNRHNNSYKDAIPFAIISPLRQANCSTSKRALNNHHNLNRNGPSKSNSQSTNCLTSPSSVNIHNSHSSNSSGNGNQFLHNLVRMVQTKVWEEARCRTFYARDNVCNFIKWSKEFGVNQSVLFESDDLVSHANPRQVVLCLLDVARIAYIKHSFTEAPGLVKFEQEFGSKATDTSNSDYEPYQRLLAGAIGNDPNSGVGANSTNNNWSSGGSGDNENHSGNGPTNGNPLSAITKRDNQLKTIGRGANAIGDATDELILRYCKHKEEQAARDRVAQQEAAAAAAAKKAKEEKEEELAKQKQQAQLDELNQKNTNQKEEIPESFQATIDQEHDESEEPSRTISKQCNQLPNEAAICDEVDNSNMRVSNMDSSSTLVDFANMETHVDSNTNCDDETPTGPGKGICERVDSLDSGEGRTESATSTSQTSNGTGASEHHSTATNDDQTTTSRPTKRPNNNSPTKPPANNNSGSNIPTLIRRANSSLSLTSEEASTSLCSSQDNLSSSRSSLLSGNEASSSKEHDPTDLDGKVMRIAKSYYGKGARRGVTRLSEGKYKIADRIVFVRLLKGHRVMVRIGGGWDTLENFLFRHKSDPSQVIDVDNLLPIETKMSFETKNNSQLQTQQTQQTQLNSATPSNTTNANRTPTPLLKSKLPFYKRSDSCSSTTNLSLSNLSISNSPTSSISNARRHHNLMASTNHLNHNPHITSTSSASNPSSPMRTKIATPRTNYMIRNATSTTTTNRLLINRGQNKPLPQHQYASSTSSTNKTNHRNK